MPTIQQFFKNDHGNYCVKSPRKLNHELQKKQKEIEKLRKRLKVAKQKSRRLAAKTKSLKAVVKELRKRNFISENCEEQLKQSLSGVQLALMKRILSGKNRRGCKYPAQLQSFALTLQFYSAKAYEFVRKAFNLALPHQAQIRRWYGKIPAQPGFTKPAFDAIKAKVETAAVEGNRVVIALMLDEMSIRKQVTWNGTNYSGYVDLGNGAELDDTAPLAKDALVLMAVCVNGHWKVPCGYFFVDGLSGSERANLVNVCLQRLWDTGARVVSVTFDGPSCHFKMAAELGASFVRASLRPSFPHPIDSQHEVTIFLDVCHMLKLVRNTLAEGGILVDHNNNKISWQYVEALHKLQESEGLRLGNKLKASHIHWRQQKMKVNLAAQTFSSSVADAIEYCANVLKLQQFQGSSATVKFIRVFDRLFDVLNSRSPLAKGFKSALRFNNKDYWNQFLEEAFDYICGLKNTTGKHMYETQRKTGFIGFLVAIRSTQMLFKTLVEDAAAPLKYLLMYKFSQDHLELFFGAIRSAGGCNNNPTAEQFTAAYKRLLMRSAIKGGRGNCDEQDKTSILYAVGDTCTVSGQQLSLTNVALIKKYDLTERPTLQEDHDYSDTPNMALLSEYKEAAISYIAGYVAKMVKKLNACMTCCDALGSISGNPPTNFMKMKDRGGLFKASASTILICNETERRFQRMLATTKGNLPVQKGIPDAIALSVLQDLDISKVFRELDDHMLECSVGDSHVFALISGIIKCYCNIRFHHLGKSKNQEASGPKIRKKLSKLVLFKHQ